MKHMNPKLAGLLIEGFSIKTLESMTKKQIEVLYEKIMVSKSEVKEQPKPIEKTVTSKVTELPSGSKVPVGNATVSNEGGKTIITQTQEGEFNESEEEDIDDVNKGEDDQDPIQKQGPDGMDEEITEKSVSKQQQKIMGLSLSVKKGDTPKKDVSNKVKKMAKEMSKKDLEDFASTKHKGLPNKIEEDEDLKNLEESIMKIVQNHLPPHTTKGELLSSLYKRKN
jgi:hypothetical protein